MFRKALFAGVGMALFAMPLVSSALTISDLQAQISALLSQIQALQGGASTSVSGSVGSSVTVGAPRICPSFARSLSVGATGSDVTSLQQFLSSQGYLNVSATGYYGPLTAAAVGKWQAQNGVAASGNAGFGIFGPLSRSFLIRWCGGATQGQSFSADPQSGPAPLSVTFTTGDSITASSTTYSVDFGDGQTGDMAKGSCVGITAIVGGQGGIRCSYTVSHTYTTNGTYTARLMKNTCPPGAECFVGPLPVASAVITVGSSSVSSVSFSASPTSGSAPLSVQFTSTAPQGSNIGSTVSFGDGTSANLLVAPVCSSCNELGTVTHVYVSAGTYTATLTGAPCACPAGGICNCPNIPILGTATVTVTAGGGTTTSNIQQLNAPGSVTLTQGGIAEVRNLSFYFTLQSISSSSATIQPTPVGCWNSFPSDPPPQVRCMIAVFPTPPQTLSVGQSYTSGNYSITLTQLSSASATFSVSTVATTAY
ncbi:MAG TPA: peptidoglycan-binding protein [Candidatus Paceibacterota bacterium]|nr:peptidoglycan-binding protein [Candidatus Paceibacterota bacterium]